MAYLKFSLIVFLFACNTAFAGYAQLKPPAGWSQGMGAAVPGTAGNFYYGAAANGSTFKGGTVLTNAALNVGGQLVTVPVSMRLASNAPLIAAASAFLNPGWFIGAAALTFAYDYYQQNKLSIENGVWKKEVTNLQCDYTGYTPDTALDRMNYVGQYTPMSGGSWADDGSCKVHATATNRNGLRESDTRQFTLPSTGTTGKVPVSQDEFQSMMSPKPLPDSAVPTWPVPLPYEIPVLNPDPQITPLPFPQPASNPRPFFAPSGNPVSTPDPNIWNQPGTRISPAPSPSSPWQVDIQPETQTQNSPTPKSPAELNPSGTPTPLPPGTPVQPGLCSQYPGIAACAPAGPTPEQVKDFCVANPDVLACQKIDLDTPDIPDLEKKDIPISITPSSGWGAGNASCPAARHLVGANVDMPFTMVCDFMNGLRPILIAIAWLSAAFILLGMKSGAD